MFDNHHHVDDDDDDGDTCFLIPPAKSILMSVGSAYFVFLHSYVRVEE